MTTSVQAVSEAGGAATISPLHIWGSLSQAAQAQVLSRVIPSTITTLGASSADAPLTYDTIGLLQTFSPNISASGLNAAQQQDLTAALGLNAQAASTDVFGANALLMPSGAAQVVVNVLVGDANAAAAKANPANLGLYNEQGVIEGVPGDVVSQARDAAMGALLNLGASGVAASAANPASNTTGGVAENQFAAGAQVAADNVPAANLNLTTAEQVEMAEPAAVIANPVSATAVAAVAAGVVTEAAPAAENVPAVNLNLTTAEQIAMAEYAAVIANPAAATAPVVSTETVATAVIEESAVIAAAEIPATPVAGAVIIAAAPVAATLTTIVADEVAATTQEIQSLPATNEVSLPGNLPAAGINVTAVQTATAAVVAPAVTGLGAAAEADILPAVTPPVASAAPVPIANTLPVIRFDNARSVLQSLLAEAAAHAIMMQRNPTSATYSLGGAMFQMGTGADHVQQYIMKDHQPYIYDMIRPISSVARIRGATERQT